MKNTGTSTNGEREQGSKKPAVNILADLSLEDEINRLVNQLNYSCVNFTILSHYDGSNIVMEVFDEKNQELIDRELVPILKERDWVTNKEMYTNNSVHNARVMFFVLKDKYILDYECRFPS